MIPPTVSTVVNRFQEELDALERALKDYRTYSSSRTDLLNRRGQIEKLLKEYLDKASKIPIGAITFDDLEINTLFLDEAHNYKNLPIETKMKNLNGINVTGSEKCMDMLRKVRSVQEANGGRGVVFATGTPLCNSISDTYAMQMYLQPKSLEKGGLHLFDNWVKTFAKPEQVLEVDVDTSKYRMVRRFGRFFNLPELSKMFSEIAVFYAMNDKDNLPKLDAYSDVVIPKSDRLTAYMQTLCERTERIRQGDVDRKKDNMLKVSTDGRKAALSLELVGREEPYDEYSKVKNCVDQVMRIYREYEHCSQLIFCDYSTPKAEQFNVYQELKLQLMEEGIPEKEIAFIHSFHSESTKLKLYEQVNAGIVRVIIGSTFKLGIGANVQTKLKAIHHLDVPWRPADMVQREGRIIRRGNENENVFIYRYISEGSFDAYSWQILENKQKFITQFLQSSSYQRTAVDLESNVLTYAEVKALALSEPLMKELAEKENELRNERILYQQEIESRKQLIRERDEVEKARDAALSDSVSADNVSSFVKGTLKKSDTMKRFLESLQKQLTPEFLDGKRATAFTVIPSVRIILPSVEEQENPLVLLSVQGQPFEVEMGEASVGNVKRVMNRFRKLQTLGDEKKKEYEDLERRRDEMDAEISAPYQHEHRVLELEAEYQRIRDQIPEGRESK